MNSNIIEKEEIGAKSDLLRYEVVIFWDTCKVMNLTTLFQIVYQYGGIYCDTDCIR